MLIQASTWKLVPAQRMFTWWKSGLSRPIMAQAGPFLLTSTATKSGVITFYYPKQELMVHAYTHMHTHTHTHTDTHTHTCCSVLLTIHQSE